MTAGMAVIGLALMAGAADTPTAPPAVEALRACRAIVAADARLACFDRAAASLDQAITARDVVVVDRQTVRRTKRSLFGLPLPSLNIFGSGDGHDSRDEPDFVAIDTVVRAARQVSYGKYDVETQDNAVWRNTDLWPDAPRVGETLHISKGAMGSYFIKSRSLPPVKGTRIR